MLSYLTMYTVIKSEQMFGFCSKSWHGVACDFANLCHNAGANGKLDKSKTKEKKDKKRE